MLESKKKYTANIYNLLKWLPETATEIYQNIK